jgi:hypothetical protein
MGVPKMTKPEGGRGPIKFLLNGWRKGMKEGGAGGGRRILHLSQLRRSPSKGPWRHKNLKIKATSKRVETA